MKKLLLLGASALALGVGSTAAYAEDPIKVTLSGTGQEWFGYATNNRTDQGAYSKVFEASNNSFSLNGSTKLDNGITVSVSLSMNASPGTEGSQAALQTKSALNNTKYAVGTGAPETSFVGFSGGFGSINFGFQPGASLGAIQDAPYLGVSGLSWARFAGWVHGPANSNLVAGSGQVVTYDDYWASKVVYSTPVFAGLQVSASFTPDMTAQDGGTIATNGNTSGNWGGNAENLALTYGGDFGSAKVKAAIAYSDENFNGFLTPGSGLSKGQGGHVNGYAGSLQVSFGGFTVGGAVNDRSVSGHTAGAVTDYDLKTALADGLTWDIGVKYTTGPFSVAANYYTSEAKDNNGNGNASATGKARVDMGGLEFEYALGPGITLDLENGYVTYKVDPTSTVSNKNDGFYSVLSTTVNF